MISAMISPARLLFAHVLLTAAAAAQTTYVVSPPGFANKSGAAFSWGVAAYPDGRSQLADGTQRTKPFAIKGISFRLTSPTSGYWNPGRSFLTVSLRMSETDISKMTSTYSTNVLSTPTLMWQGGLSLPFVTGPHQSVPAPWSLHFPFRTSWSYNGSKDILADFDFSGGKLANGQAWSTNPNAYLWDAANGSPWAYGQTSILGNTHSRGCVDSGSVVSTLSGAALMNVVNYHPKDIFNPKRGKLVVEQSAISFGALVPAMMLFGFQPNASGVPFPGVTCNRVHVGLGAPFLATFGNTDRIGRIPAHHPATGANGIPMVAAYVGVPVVAQGAWNDSKKGNLLLSSAVTARIPPTSKVYDVAAVHGPGKVTGNPSVDARSNHIRRYTK